MKQSWNVCASILCPALFTAPRKCMSSHRLTTTSPSFLALKCGLNIDCTTTRVSFTAHKTIVHHLLGRLQVSDRGNCQVSASRQANGLPGGSGGSRL